VISEELSFRPSAAGHENQGLTDAINLILAPHQELRHRR